MTTCGYQIAIIDPPDSQPITLAEAKKQCKIDNDITEEDDLLQEYIDTATELAEEYCKRSFVQRTLEVTFDDFPRDYYYADNRVVLPQGPVLAVVSFAYTTWDGTVTEFTADQYRLGVDNENRPYLRGAQAFATWPSAQCGFGAVRVRYLAGYASVGSPADAVNVPKRAKQAIRMLVGHFYNNRESVVAETRIIPVAMEYSFERLLDGLRVLA